MYTNIGIVRRDVLPRYANITACVAVVVGRAAGLQRVKYFLEFVELRRCVPPRESTIFLVGTVCRSDFFFQTGLSTRVPSAATMPFSHRPTLKQKNKPFKSGHATKGSLKRASKGTWNALQLSCVTDSRQVRTSQIPVVPSRLVRTKHMLFEQQAALRDRGRIEEMRRARCHNRSVPPLWKARVYFPAQACEGRHVHQVGDQVAITRQVHHVFVQYLPLHLMQKNGMLCGRWRTMARP